MLSVAATTIRLSFIIALCVGLALLGAVIGIAKAFVDTAPTLDLAALDAQDKTSFIYDSEGTSSPITRVRKTASWSPSTRFRKCFKMPSSPWKTRVFTSTTA
ncbi:MAG: hypothetical protein ACLTV6_05350 [Christensenellales bacterium]